MRYLMLAAALFALAACSDNGYPPGAVAYVGRSDSVSADGSVPKETGTDAGEEERDVLPMDGGDESLPDIAEDVANEIVEGDVVADAGDETLVDVTDVVLEGGMDVRADVVPLDTGADAGGEVRADVVIDTSVVDVRPDAVPPDRPLVDVAMDAGVDTTATDILPDVPLDRPSVDSATDTRMDASMDVVMSDVMDVVVDTPPPPWLPRVAYEFTSSVPGGGAITGFFARVVNLRVAPGSNIITPNLGGERGMWRFNPCAGGVRVGPPVSCTEINVATLLPPGGGWDSEYAIEIDAMAYAVPLCGTDSSCRGCWSSAMWGCGMASCVAGGELPRNNVVSDATNYPGGPRFTVFRLQPQGIPGARRAPCMPPR